MGTDAPPIEDVRLPARLAARPSFSRRHPAAYPLAVLAHRACRQVRWLLQRKPFASTRTVEPLTIRVHRHKSPLLRRLGESEMRLQHGKVVNLRLACTRVDGLLIRPGEVFSFNRTVGNCTRRKGYVEGLRLSNGEAVAGVGGGLCQLANLLHWMVLHSPLTVVERSEHSFDPFPDQGRVLPWGVGCSIVYNYVDLVVRNDTDATFQFLVSVGDRFLEGELRCDRALALAYSVHARDERFLRCGGEIYRRNEIWRTVIDRRTGAHVGEELLRENCALVKYLPVGVDVLDVPLSRSAAPAARHAEGS